MANLLTKYSDEKLKQIKLSIQEKEASSISREEIEHSLRKEGLTLIADGLKDNIEKGKLIVKSQSFLYYLVVVVILMQE